MEHTYTAKIKASAKKARGVEAVNKSSPMRKSAITEIMLAQEQRANIALKNMPL